MERILYADLLIQNAVIYTADVSIDKICAGEYDFPIYRSGFVAAKGGKTIDVGEGDGAPYIGPKTEVIDAKGAVLIPGMMDSHMHALFSGLDKLSINYEGCKDLQEFQARLKAGAEATPQGEWVKGLGWNEMLWTEKKMPTRGDLDKVSPNHPAYACRLCHHVYVCNSKALEAAGITKDTPDPDGGFIGRDESGEPNGLLYENAAMGLIDAVIPPPTEDYLIKAITIMGQHLNACGLTACIDCNLPFPYMRAYLRAKKEGKLTYRTDLMVYTDKAWGDMDFHLKRIGDLYATTGFGDDMLKINGIKVTLDGIPATGTAAMRQPYDHMPETSGDTMYTREEMIELGKMAGRNGWQIGIHCCGDRSADVAMDCFEAAYKEAGNMDARHYIIHMAITQPDQVERLKDLRVPVTVQPTINLQMGEQGVIGDRLVKLYQKYKDKFDAGIIVGGSSDCPVVDCNPFEGMYGAITRMTALGTQHLPEEALTPQQAFLMWTRNSTYFSHDEDQRGYIGKGALADYVLIDTPILETTPEKIRATKVLRTILGGKTVYLA